MAKGDFVKCPGCGRVVLAYSTWTSSPKLPAFCLECLTDGKMKNILSELK